MQQDRRSPPVLSLLLLPNRHQTGSLQLANASFRLNIFLSVAASFLLWFFGASLTFYSSDEYLMTNKKPRRPNTCTVVTAGGNLSNKHKLNIPPQREQQQSLSQFITKTTQQNMFSSNGCFWAEFRFSGVGTKQGQM